MIEEYLKLLSEGYLHKQTKSFGHYGIAIDMTEMPSSNVAWINEISLLYSQDTYCALSIYKMTEQSDSYLIGFIKKESNGKYCTIFKGTIPNVTLWKIRELLIFLEEHNIISNNKALDNVVEK